MMRTPIALAAGLGLIALAVGFALSRSPLTLAGSAAPGERTLSSTVQPAAACQTGETLPRGTSAVRLGLETVIGPRVTLRVLSGSRVLASGVRAPGWSGASVTIPVQPVPRTVTAVRVCFGLTLMNGSVSLRGSASRPGVAARSEAGDPLPGRVSIEYLRAGHASWLSMAASVARRLGLGRAAPGSWNALLVMLLVAGCLALSSWLVLKELG